MTTHTPYVTIVYTHYVGPTDTKGSRIVATAQYFGRKSRTTVSRNPAMSGDDNHLAAAFAFLAKNTSDVFELIGVSDHPTGSGSAWIFKRKEG